MNVITIAGVLGKDAELRHMPNGDPVAGFSVADSQGKEKPTIWWSCQLFGKRAESLLPYLTKACNVTATGNVTEREWVDKDGQKRKSMEVRVNDLALQGGRSVQAQAPQRSAPAAPAPRQASSGFEDMSDDVPFANPMRSRAFCLSI